MSTADEALSAAVERAALAVPGVTAVLMPGHVGGAVVEAGARLLGVRGEDAPLVRVDEGSDPMRVDLAVGVSASRGAGATVRDVYDAVAAVVSERRGVPADVRVTVAHVDAPVQGY